MFVGFGAGSAWFGNALLANRRPLEIAAGIFVIIAALLFAGVPLPRVLAAERRLHGSYSRARSDSSAGCKAIGGRSRSPRPRCSSPSACFSSPANLVQLTTRLARFTGWQI